VPTFFADELLRQVTLDLPERGLLLLRVRDEIRMTIEAYRTLYEASITFGVRKQLQAEHGIPELETSLSELGERKKDLEAQVQALRARIDVIERRQAERRVLDDKRRAEEITYLKHQAKNLDTFLKSMPKA
jgi:dynein light intermediate chain